MRRVTETDAILHQIVEATGQTSERVKQVVSALRDAIDGLFLDGYTIYAPPFTLTYRSDPVAPIFAERVERASGDEIEAWHLGDLEATAQWLGVPPSVYLRHPVASDLRVLIELLDALKIEDADSPAGNDAVAVAEAWFDTFREERPYRLGNVGLERDLEAWLIHHTERLVQIGYDVRLHRQQFVLPDRRRPDLVFDLVEDDGAPGALIVELKATSAYLGAVDQLVGYLDAFTSLGLAKGVLRGLLVADGIPPDVLAYAEEKGVETATLTELGYRRDLAANLTTTAAVTSPQPSSSDHQIGATVSRVYQMFHGMDSDRAEPQATLVFAEGGLCSWVSNQDAFATLAPGHIFTLRLDEIAGVMKSQAFVPVSEQEPEHFDAIVAASEASGSR
jgi:hypothetical protein